MFPIPTIKGAVVIAGIAFAGAGGGVLADAAISADTHITLGGALGVAGVVVSGAWYLSARLEKLNARLRSIEEHLGLRSKNKKHRDNGSES